MVVFYRNLGSVAEWFGFELARSWMRANEHSTGCRQPRNHEGPQIFTTLGSVAEWLKATVLKTVVLKGTRGSNPLASSFTSPKSR